MVPALLFSGNLRPDNGVMRPDVIGLIRVGLVLIALILLKIDATPTPAPLKRCQNDVCGVALGPNPEDAYSGDMADDLMRTVVLQ